MLNIMHAIQQDNNISTCISFISVLKDVPVIPLESYGPRQRDNIRLSVFPNLNYTGLYEAVLKFIELVPTIQIGAAGKSKFFKLPYMLAELFYKLCQGRFCIY